MAADSWFLSAVSSVTALTRAATSSAICSRTSGAGARTAGAMTAANWARTRASIRSVLASTPDAFANIRTLNGSTTATAIPAACRLRRTSRCHLPVASMTTRLRSNCISHRLSLRMPSRVFVTRRVAPPGTTCTSSQLLLTSIPALDFTAVSCSDTSLPCMRDLLPIICSGQEPRSGWTKLSHGALSQGCRGPIRSRRGPRPRSPTPNHFAVSRQNQHARGVRRFN